MSHFLDRLTYFSSPRETFLRRPRRGHRRGPHLGRRLPQPLGARQDRALHARRELHRLVLVEDLRQGRHRHLGDPADRLSAHALGHAQPRAARLRARRELQLVSVQRQSRQVSDGARPPAEELARGAPGARPGRRVGLHRRRRRQAPRLPAGARPRRLRALELGRGQRDRRRSQRLHDQEARPRPHHRLFADSGHVDGQLCRRLALPEPDRRRVHELLRLVLRPAAEQPAGLGRADRRARVGRLVQLELHHRLGLQRAADAHARRALLHRGALQGHEDGRGDAGLLRGRQARRHLDAPQAGHRRRGGDGDGPRDPEGVLLPRRRQGAQRLLRRLRAPLHRHADAGDAEGAHAARRRGHHGARPLRARVGLRRQAGPGQQPGVEDGRLRRDAARSCCRTARSAFAGAPTGAPTRASGTSRPRKRATAAT